MAIVSFTASSATTYDLTDPAVNAEAAAEVTPREGGFTSRNRINFANVTAPTLAASVMNVLKLVKVPERSVITDVFLSCPRGKTAVTHAVTSSSIASATAGLGFSAYKSASHSSVSADADGFGIATVTASKIHTSSIVALPTATTTPKTSVRHVAAGIAGAANGWADGGGDQQNGMHFPYGGFITFQLTAGKGKSGTAAASLNGALSGVLEVSCQGFKIPE